MPTFMETKGCAKNAWKAGLDSEGMRAKGIIVLVKSNQLVKNIENKKLLAS